MFTGIITALGQIVEVNDLGTDKEHGKQLCVQTPDGYLADVGLGDSVALNGACMTVTRLDLRKNTFYIDISAESLACTVGLDQQGTVNLEKALRPNDRLGGHLVSGHVDGVGKITHFASLGESWELRILATHAIGRYLAYKGSITVNGVSLTVNSVRDDEQGCEFSINLIPHTVQNTALHTLKTGSPVNLEVDLIARYVERMLSVKGTVEV